jgi:hypothetical protein
MYDNEVYAALRQVALQFITEFFLLKLINMSYIQQIILLFILATELMEVLKLTEVVSSPSKWEIISLFLRQNLSLKSLCMAAFGGWTMK